MHEIAGWLLDLYPITGGGLALWLICANGQRRQFRHVLPFTFYASGPEEQLNSLSQWLQLQESTPTFFSTTRRDLFQPKPIPVLAITVNDSATQTTLFRQASIQFPNLNYYDADLPPALRHAAAFGSFPLANCRLQADANGHVTSFTVVDTPWDPDPLPAPLRILKLEPDCDPRHAQPTTLLVSWEKHVYRLPLHSPRVLLTSLAALVNQIDPDLLLTGWGDSWMIPKLLKLSQDHRIPLPLNRDPHCEQITRPERTYFAYGQVVYRDQQIHLFGRCHIDRCNATLYHDYGLEGVFELGRVTGLPLQTVARVSPGSGVSAMQMITALRKKILVPWHKQEPEQLKTAAELIRSDQGGLVYQPAVGLHTCVAELDFISMFPSIMVYCNISPETLDRNLPNKFPGNRAAPGLIPTTLAPLLKKRIALKQKVAALPATDPRRRLYKARVSAHKWLLVTCFGYLGYKNARFGRIEAHEAVTAYSREALLRAKEAAEDAGYEVLHLYVDGLWVYRKSLHPEELQALLEEITLRTGLPIALEGIYNWVAFLPSRRNNRIPVANRYFGVFQDGTIKARGIEARRRDTPLWIAEVQMEILRRLAQETTPEKVQRVIPKVIEFLQQQIASLKAGTIPIQKLVVAQKLSRELQEYLTLSPAARAAAQLATIGKSTRPGQMVCFLITTGSPGVHAWDLGTPPEYHRLDLDQYCTLLLRAAATLLHSFGVEESQVRRLVFNLAPTHQALHDAPRLFKG